MGEFKRQALIPMSISFIQRASYAVLGAGSIINLIILFPSFSVAAIVGLIPYLVAAGIVAIFRHRVLALLALIACLALVVHGTPQYLHFATLYSETRGIGLTFTVGFQLLNCAALFALLSIGRAIIALLARLGRNNEAEHKCED